MSNEIQIGDIKAQLIRKNIKSIHLSVLPPLGLVRISAPLQIGLEVIHSFALSKLNWIKRHQRRLQRQAREPIRIFVKHTPEEEKFYRKQLQNIVPGMVLQWELRLNVKVNRMSFRQMRTRWGSCTPAQGTIRLSTELAKKSQELLEYVVVHEMLHLIEPSHNARFNGLMDLHLPNWREYKRALNGRA